MLPILATHLARATAPFMPDVLWRVPSQERTLYLTFDDGPTPQGTSALLRVLESYNARVTFFLVGKNIEAHPGQVQDLLAAGHTLGNHTYTHPDAWKTSWDSVQDELERTTDLLTSLTNQPIYWMRPPYGHLTSAMRAWCKARCQRMVMWDVLPGDLYPKATAHSILHRIKQFARPGSVVVLHDNPRFNPVSLPGLEATLAAFSRSGWTFAPLPKVLSI